VVLVFAVQDLVFVVQVLNSVVHRMVYIQDGQVHHILVVIAVLQVVEVVIVVHLMAIADNQLNIVVVLVLLLLFNLLLM
jgi:hypothetical protein